MSFLLPTNTMIPNTSGTSTVVIKVMRFPAESQTTEVAEAGSSTPGSTGLTPPSKLEQLEAVEEIIAPGFEGDETSLGNCIPEMVNLELYVGHSKKSDSSEDAFLRRPFFDWVYKFVRIWYSREFALSSTEIVQILFSHASII